MIAGCPWNPYPTSAMDSARCVISPYYRSCLARQSGSTVPLHRRKSRAQHHHRGSSPVIQKIPYLHCINYQPHHRRSDQRAQEPVRTITPPRPLGHSKRQSTSIHHTPSRSKRSRNTFRTTLVAWSNNLSGILGSPALDRGSEDDLSDIRPSHEKKTIRKPPSLTGAELKDTRIRWEEGRWITDISQDFTEVRLAEVKSVLPCHE